MARRHGNRMLVAIGAFKLVKAAVLVTAGVALFALARDGDAAATLVRWAREAHLDPGGRLLRGAIGALAGLEPGHRALIGAALFVYAAVFLVEGIGLVLRKPWAEWMTIIVTASLVPLELYELVREVRVTRALVLAANLAILAYLVWRVRADRREAPV